MKKLNFFCVFGRIFQHPVILAIALAVVICCPYMAFMSGKLLSLRLLSSVLYAFSVVCLAYLLRAGSLYAALIGCCTLLYIFVSYCEVGNYLVKGDTFQNEFWQFADVDAIILSLQIVPLLAVVGLFSPVLIGVAVFWFLKRMDLGRRGDVTVPVLLALLAVVAAGTYVNMHFSSISQMRDSHVAYATMAAEVKQAHYVRKVPLSSQVVAKPGKNILHIFLESFGDIYTDTRRFPGLAPNLARYKEQGVWAANMLQTPNQANSYMGHFAVEYGRYSFIKPDAGEEALCLGNVLSRAGYKNIFIRGAGPNMAGPFLGLYSPDNGYESFIASHILEKKYDRSFISGFGYSDEVLFQEALDQYEQLIMEDAPFQLTLFTLDTHGFPQDISHICKKEAPYTGPFEEDPMVQAAHCTDTLVGDFLNKISRLPKFEDLIMVLHADHVQHNITPAIMPDSQKIYAVILGNGIDAFKQEQETHLMDIAPTMLSLAGVETNARFYAGDDFSGPMSRSPVLNREIMEEPFSDEASFQQFSVINAPAMEQVSDGDLHSFGDDRVEISYAKLDGVVFSSAYIYIKNKQSLAPFFVLYPLQEHIPKKFFPSKGVLLDKSSAEFFTTGISFGVKSLWEGALLEDLSSGLRWKIDFRDQRIVAVKPNRLYEQRPVFQEEVYGTVNCADFVELNQVKCEAENIFNIFGADPKMYIEIPLSTKQSHLVVVEMEAPQKDLAKLYYEVNNESYSELNASSAFVEKGKNKIRFFLPRGIYSERFRFDIGEKTGRYKFSSLRVFALSTSEG